MNTKETLTVVYDVYNRMGPAQIRMGIVNGPDARTCLLKILDKIGMYADSKEVLEEEAAEGRTFTVEEIIEMYIANVNGDGCDFVSFIRDKNGVMLFQAFEDDWRCVWEETI